MVVAKGHFYSQPPPATGVVMTLGNFDGLHRGHQFLLSELEDYSAGAKTMALTFSPHPSHVVGNKPDPLLYSEDDKLAQFQKTGVDYLVIQDFSLDFAQLSAEDFLRQFLFPIFSPRKILLGHDFNFGHKGEGGFPLAKKLADDQGIEVKRAEPFRCQGEIVSSTRIRELLSLGQIEKATSFLGRPFHIQGVVKQGLALGRTMGFPTANIIPEALIPGHGVYAGVAEFEDRRYKAVLNIGLRPTLAGKPLSVECHLLNFSGDLYEKKLKFYFIDKIRDEKKFSDMIKLKEQIQKDIGVAEDIIKRSSFFNE